MTKTPLNKLFWQEQWNKLLWGPQLELDKAEAASFAQAKTQARLTAKGAQLGKGKKHWSNVAIYTNDYERYPFELGLVVVEAVYFSWDEMCDKFKQSSTRLVTTEWHSGQASSFSRSHPQNRGLPSSDPSRPKRPSCKGFLCCK